MEQVILSPSQKAETITKFLWKSAVNYLEEVNIPPRAIITTFFWDSFFYTVRDILIDNDLDQEVLNQFVPSVSQLFDIPMVDVETLAVYKKFQRITLDSFVDGDINPATSSGTRAILSLANTVIHPNEEFDSPIDPTHMVAYTSAALEVTQFVSIFLSKTSSSAAAKIPAQSKSPSTSTNSSREPLSHDHLTRMLLYIFGFIILIILVGAMLDTCGGTSSSNISTNSSYNSPAKQTDPTVALIPVNEPLSGKIFKYPADDMVAPFEVKTVKGYGYYFILKPINKPINKISFYVRGGSTVEILVPVGTYEVYYATGETWYGEQYLFGPDTVYQKCDTTFLFLENSDGYSGWTLQLQPVYNGNLDTELVSESEFPN